MQLPMGRGRRNDMQDVLRSLGALLDARLAQDVRITEVADGLHVRAHMVAGVADRIAGRWTTSERRFTRLDLRRLQADARRRRGQDHVPGRHERCLRMAGRAIDERGLRDLTLIQYPGGGWLVWHTDGRSARFVLTFLAEDELLARSDEVAAVRESILAVDRRVRAIA
jgi:hypothetical protein